MMIRVESGDSRPIYLQIMDEVRRAVALGLTQPDEPMPSVRSLATELRVNPNTVQQAYRELEREGVVYVKRGLGTFVSRSDPDRGERRSLARDVADRALREAYRYGLTVEELISALEEAKQSREEESQ